jgi:hypothetical protein
VSWLPALALVAHIAAGAPAVAGPHCPLGPGGGPLVPLVAPDDAMLAGDPVSRTSGRVREIVPGAPWIVPGPDGVFGTPDDMVRRDLTGDVDIVVRAGDFPWAGAIPPAAASGATRPGAAAVAEPFGVGPPIRFSVIPSDGLGPDPAGSAVSPPYFRGLPVLVLAFADLDGDGYVGITHLDGFTNDAAIERAELKPVGRRFAIGDGNRAEGELFLGIGAPQGLRVALAAAALAGPYENPEVACVSCHGWAGPARDAFAGPFDVEGANLVPDGPAVMTHLPFLPVTNYEEIRRKSPRKTVPATPAGRVGVEVRVALEPDPGDARIGEAFTLRLDGSDPSIDVAVVRSGPLSRFGAAVVAHSWVYRESLRGTLRCGLDRAGYPSPVEVLRWLEVPDDGPGSKVHVQIVPLDRLGNVAQVPAPTPVSLRTRGTVRIHSPDTDGDPQRETIVVDHASGTRVVLDDGKSGVWDDPGMDSLAIEGAGALSRIDLYLHGVVPGF